MERIKNLVKHPLFSGSLIMVGGNMAMNVVNYLYHIIMGRMLGPADYGVLASLYSVIYLVGVVPTSSSVAIVKFISSAKNESEAYSVYKGIWKFVMKLAVISSIILAFFSPLIAKFLNISNMGSVLMISPVLFFLLITLVNQATSQGLLKFMGSVGPGFSSSVIKLVLGVFLIYIGWSVFGAMVGVAVGMAIAFIYSHLFLQKNLRNGNSKEIPLKPFFKYAFPVLVQALAFTSIFTSDMILVKHFLSPYNAGIYGALSTLGKIVFFAVSPIAAAMFPIITKRITNKESYIKILTAAFSATLSVSLLVLAFYYFFPNLAIGVLYGEAYLIAVKELFWMGLFMLFYSLSSFLVNFLLSKGDVRIVWLPFATALIQTPLLWFFHSSLMQVIQVNLALNVVLFVALSFYLGYNRLGERER